MKHAWSAVLWMVFPALSLAGSDSLSPFAEWRSREITRALASDPTVEQRVRIALEAHDQRMKAIHERTRGAMDIVERAADGDPAALAKLDGALTALDRAHSDLADAERDLLAELAKGTKPRDKARLVLALRAHPQSPP